MTRFLKESLCLVALVGVTVAAADWQLVYTTNTPATQQLRGYGAVATAFSEYRGDNGGSVWVMRFRCASPEFAATLAGKYLADLGLSQGIEPVSVGDTPARRLPDGSAIVGCVDGAEARLIGGTSTEVLTTFKTAQPAAFQGAVDQAPYPTFLDRFDRYGWGVYGLGGYTNHHDWMKKAIAESGGTMPLNPVEDLDFLAKYHYRFEPWLDPVHFDNSDGLQRNSEVEWMVKQAAERKLPVSFRVYGAAGGADWTARRFPEYGEQPAWFMMSGWHGAQLYWRAQTHLTWFDPDIHRYMAAKTMAMMRPYADNPDVMGWMHPHGELAHDQWYDMHDDYSVRARHSWHAYLQRRGYDLAGVTRLFGHEDQPFGDWDQVPIPEYATFAGLEGRVKSLAGTWFWRREREKAKPEDTTFAGLDEKWYAQPLDPAKWQSVEAPGSDALFDVIPKTLGSWDTTWFRRTFTLTADQLENQPLYLYWFPMGHVRIHSGKNARFHDVFVNGQPAGAVGQWGALDVSKLLKVGDNQIALHLFGPVWNGRIFLSTQAPAVYPYLGEARNHLWVLWLEWHVDSKFEAWREILDGMRQVDPDRPIKFMAPIKFGADRWLNLATNYGGWGHFTGEGIWFFPWYKRYGFLYGLPASSETGGPANNIADQFNSYRRTFLAGLNGHDPVFLAQTYTRSPELRQFWIDHAPILHRMGTYDIDGPQVLLYRSTRGTILMGGAAPHPELGESTREIQNGWNWDIGRGSLQTLGHSYLYLDDGGLSDGKMTGFPLVVDCGNEAIPESSIDALKPWIESGGTYVTFPFSGRNGIYGADTWPIQRLTGCAPAKIRPLGGKVTFAKDQQVFRGLAGQTFPDNGQSLDYVGNNHNLMSVELKPQDGVDAEVLATYENGAPAIVRRRLGRGQVIVLGTAFWRQCEDRMGLWWPEPLEDRFLADLLRGVGFPAAACTTDDRLVWAQPYRANNGLDAVTCLVSWHDDAAADVTVSLRLPKRPVRLVSYGVDGIHDLPFEWRDGQAVAKVNMPAKEVKVIAAPVYSPFEAVSHWWNYQQRLWHQLAKPTIDFTPYTRGKWADPTLDLRPDAAFTQTPPASDDWERPGFDDSRWTRSALSVFTLAADAAPGQPLWARKTFRVPGEWAAQGGKIYLISGAWSGPHYLGQTAMRLNGGRLHDFTTNSYNEYDVTRLLEDGENVVSFEFKGDVRDMGIVGNVYLYHWVPPLRSVDLAGVWQGTDLAGKVASLTFPGAGQLRNPTRTVDIPAEWEGKFQVRYHAEGDKGAVLGVWVNGQLVRRHHHNFGDRCDIDVTNYLRYGERNTLVLANAWPGDDKKLAKWDFRSIALDLHPVKE